MNPRSAIRIGTQGWDYREWVGRFYPIAEKQGDWLAVYARAFDTVEVDSTFYAVPRPERFESWRERTPETFLFSLKLPGEITHELRLEDDGRLLRIFCKRARLLGPQLGPLLVQLPPDFGPDRRAVLRDFLARLPEGFRFAVEFRDRDWLTADTLSLLDDAGAALCVSVGPWLGSDDAIDAARRAPGDLLYLRWLGRPRERPPEDEIAARNAEIEAWARALKEIAADGTRAVVGYFNNDFQGHAPHSARRLQEALGLEAVRPDELSEQRELFR